ncbi:MAG TPA: UDP-glucose/GDP-mannose dehydrogenase family protein [Acidimicrobiales bacterium]|nr:UDP-glucose/GDP-mannose dehydrogenase family protein [Acidimicrobiales bacterium]
MPSRIAVIGSGYVGTVVAACFAHLGHAVTGVEIDSEKLSLLRQGKAPFHEAGLDDLLSAGTSSGGLCFTDNVSLAMERCELVFICVGTPTGHDGHPDMSATAAVAKKIAPNLKGYHVVVVKSTVPIGTGRWLRTLIEDHLPAGYGPDHFSIVSNPEFLREGNAVQDFLYPDRVVLGGDRPQALDLVAEAYRPVLDGDFPKGPHRPGSVPVIFTSTTTAEAIKYASNSFLASKISFVNELAKICELVGADVTEVTAAMGLDMRIGGQFLDAGLGWGGSCFGKDLRALIAIATRYGYDARILRSALAVNVDQRKVVVEKLLQHLKVVSGARIGVLGLAFKAGTDDLRDSPAVGVCEALLDHKAVVTAYDPMVPTGAGPDGVLRACDAIAVAERADAVVVATEWPQFLSIDLSALRSRMRGRLLLDARNLFQPEKVQAAGLEYVGIGRSQPGERVLQSA